MNLADALERQTVYFIVLYIHMGVPSRGQTDNR